jgi:hypothetical protein
LRFNAANFSEPCCRRFSSCSIFFLNFFGFIILLLLAPKVN